MAAFAKSGGGSDCGKKLARSRDLTKLDARPSRPQANAKRPITEAHFCVPFLSRKQIMAIAAVIEIAVNTRDRPISAGTITLNQKAAKRHLERILQALVHQGIITSRAGSYGGYQLAREPHLITLEEIVRCMIEKEAGDAPQSIIAKEIVIPALHEAETLFSEALRRLSIDDFTPPTKAKRRR